MRNDSMSVCEMDVMLSANLCCPKKVETRLSRAFVSYMTRVHYTLEC